MRRIRGYRPGKLYKPTKPGKPLQPNPEAQRLADQKRARKAAKAVALQERERKSREP